jgi:hypothetical protein
MGCRVATFQNASALHNPVGIEAQTGVEVVVSNNHIRHVFARADDPDAHQGSALRPGRWSLAAHRFDARNGVRPVLPHGREQGLYERGILNTEN